MNILFVGASSFTGYWFASELANRGHNVFATFQQNWSAYDGLRKQRIDDLPKSVIPVWNASIHSANLLDFVDGVGRWDLLCLHGAHVSGHRDPDFNYVSALGINTQGLSQLIEKMARCGLKRAIATGTVFEAHEGCGEEPLVAFSPYGLSKTITWEVQQYLAHRFGLKLGKFVIPNPFGPFEEPRFTSYLVKSWYEGQVPEVRTPLYVRDNIHVSLLAVHYATFAEADWSKSGIARCAPLGYVESQGAFTQRFALEMRLRLSLDCSYILRDQNEFSEPYMRVNTQKLNIPSDLWQESEAWEKLATYYSGLFSR